MAAQKYEVRVKVRLRPGVDRNLAHSGFGKLFKLAPAQVAVVFAAGKDAVKRDLDHATALMCQAALAKYGIESEVVAVDTAGDAARPVSVADASSAPADTPSNVVSATSENAPPEPAAPGWVSAPPQPPSAPARADFAADEYRALPIRFHGAAGEFFRIWIVNLVLSILTLGIYSAWAKVRTNRYLYGNTELDGHRFDYLANPITILKGRLVAAALLIAYILIGELLPVAQLVLGLIVVLLIPVLVVRAMRFHLRMSAYRNIRFGFDGQIGGAYATFIGWPIVAVLTLWIALPFAIFKQQRYLASGMRFGTQAFSTELTAKGFYQIYGKALLFGLVGGLGAALFGAAVPVLAGVLVFLLYVFLIAYVTVNQINLVRNALQLGPHRFVSSYELKSWVRLQAVNLIAIAISLGLLIPWAKIRSMNYNAEHLNVMAHGSLDEFTAREDVRVSAMGEEIGDAFDVIDVGVGI